MKSVGKSDSVIEGILKVFSTLALVSLPRFGTGWCFVYVLTFHLYICRMIFVDFDRYVDAVQCDFGDFPCAMGRLSQ